MRKKRGKPGFFLIFLSILLVFFIKIILAYVSSPNPINLWNRTINGPQNSSDYGRGVALDSFGNIYIVGGIWWTGSSEDIYLGKFNSSGNNLWNVTLNGIPSGFDEAYGAAVYNNSDIYVVGGSDSFSNEDIYLGKFNSSGNNLWNRTINGPQNSWDEGYSVAVDNNSNIYVVGASYWAPGLKDDIYLGKFNSSGSNLWNRTINGVKNDYDEAYGVAVDNSSNIYVTGTTNWSGTFDLYLGKFNSSGSNLWNFTLNGPQSAYDQGTGIVIYNNSDIYVVGHSRWSSASSSDIYLGKFNSSGNNLWNVTINGPQNSWDSGSGIAVDNNSNIYIIGTSYWSSDSSGDIYIGKFNSSGSNLWNFSINGLQNNSDNGEEIVVYNNSDIYIVGSSYWSSAGSDDIYLGKFYEDIIPPNINITSPGNNTNTTDVNLDILYARSDNIALGSCWYSNDSYSINMTLANCDNITTVTWGAGQHNVTIWANDSSGNENWSRISFNVSCTESWTYTDWGTCSNGIQTRTATDSNSCGTTEDMGALSQTCSEGGGGGGRTSSHTSNLTNHVEVSINNSQLDVIRIIIDVFEGVSRASVNATRTSISDITEQIGISGILYQVFNVTTKNITSDNIRNVTIDFKVNKSWISQNNGTSSDIRLHRKANSSAGWENLLTNLKNQDTNYYYYSAISPGFSIFAIFYGKYECQPGANRCYEEQTQLCLGNSTWLITEKCKFGCENGECIETAPQSIIVYTLLIAIVSISIILTSYLILLKIFKRKRE
jgi:PGF-pre-PGF domain-containing protein